jgi:hypothetical protein
MASLLHTLETKLLRRPAWLGAAPAPAIRVSDSGFAVRELVVPWDAVSRIKAWRGDGICLDIGADIGAYTGAHVIALREGQRGFDDFVAMADRRMTFPLGWWDHLGGPATRRHGFTLFERFSHG